MNKGNINYKYLRRRKSWFRRNIPLVIMWAVIAVVVIVLGIIGSMKLFGYGIFKNKNNDDKNPDVIDRLCRFAFIMATLGVLTVGVCPAFGVMGIVVGTIFKSKKFPLSNLNKDRIKKANFLGIVSLFLFVIDIILLVVFKSKFKA